MDWSIHWITILGTLCLYWARAEGALSGWSDSPTQYHVQTDEGPERFFRFQTFNGQYRRERRMDDGTVIGSYGWVDPTGLLRMTDYIADSAGYRVVKSRMEFVGVKPQPEEEKKKPFKPMKHSTRVIRPRHSGESFQKLASNEAPKRLFEAPTIPPRLTMYPARTIGSTTPDPPVQLDNATYSTLGPEIAKPERPAGSENHRKSKRIIRVYGRRPSAQNLLKAAEAKPEGSVSPVPAVQLQSNRPYIIQYTPKNEGGSDVFRSYTTPLRRGTGFIYKIPTQYHKEETESDGSRVGSFGYVDPFGIRRVIHYNAGKSGFDHRVDFQFVGKQNP